jgi:predicted lipoprotein with Yx(FWY)xxD motif
MRRTSLSCGAVVIVVLGLALGACGKSSTSKKAADTTTTEAAPTTVATTASAALVTTKSDAKLGTILADASGMTLYTLTSGGSAVACTGACASAWPPLELPSGVTTPTGAAGVTGLGSAPGPNSTMLVTHAGLPLYHFSGDKTPADANGEALSSFGGTWHVVKAASASTTPTTSGTAATTPTTGGYGY